MKATKGLEYSLLDGGVAVLAGIGYCEKEDVVVPSSISGFPVVGVAEKAFCRSDKIKSITLPSSVRYIDEQAFAWCRNLERVSFESVLEIGERAFMGCDKLNSIDWGNELEVIGEKAFAYCTALKFVSLPESVSALGEASFEGCRGLVSIDLSNSVKMIENSTFSACTSLRQVKLPKRLEYIDEYAFAYCTAITEMLVPSKTVLNSAAFFECGNFSRSGVVS
jgi:hypothetical protein